MISSSQSGLLQPDPEQMPLPEYAPWAERWTNMGGSNASTQDRASCVAALDEWHQRVVGITTTEDLADLKYDELRARLYLMVDIREGRAVPTSKQDMLQEYGQLLVVTYNMSRDVIPGQDQEEKEQQAPSQVASRDVSESRLEGWKAEFRKEIALSQKRDNRKLLKEAWRKLRVDRRRQ